MDRWQRTGRTLGEGGQAQVLVVRDRTGQLEGEFALKILKNRERAARLDLEISTMKSLARTGASVMEIVDDYTVFEPDTTQPWYVMPIANGGNLHAHICLNECFGGSENVALRMFSDIVAAVRSLHDNGVAHRDLKPANILIHDDRILLCDLGLCLPLSSDTPQDRLTGELERIGSLHYIPKEAFGRQPIDRYQYALDAYALGKILYELLAGRVLLGFTSPNEPDYDLLRVREKPLYAGINAVLRGLLHEDPERRLQVLTALPARVDKLLEWASEIEQEEADTGLRDKLATASEALARAIAVSPKTEASASTKAECESIATEIMKTWEDSPVLKRIEEDLVGNNPEILELRRAPLSNQLRELVHGAFIKTHRGLEPLEDLGYPRRPAAESGCAIGVIPREGGSVRAPQLWLGCLVDVREDKLSIGLALTKRGTGIDAYSDLISDTEFCLRGSPDDPSLIKRALDHAKDLVATFAEQVVAELTKLGKTTQRGGP